MTKYIFGFRPINLISRASKSIFSHFLELTFFLDEESNKEVKAICQPEFFANTLTH